MNIRNISSYNQIGLDTVDEMTVSLVDNLIGTVNDLVRVLQTEMNGIEQEQNAYRKEVYTEKQNAQEIDWEAAQEKEDAYNRQKMGLSNLISELQTSGQGINEAATVVSRVKPAHLTGGNAP